MGGTQPLFDMSKAQPIQASPLFDMSKAQPIEKPDPGATPPNIKPPHVDVKSPEGPIAQGLTTFETKLSEAPGAIGRTLAAKHWPIVDAKNYDELGHDIKSLNPIDTSEGSTAMNIGGTAANLLPLLVDAEGEGIGESPAGKIAKSTVPPIVRNTVRGANTVLEKAPGVLGGATGAALGHASGIPEGGTLGAIAGYKIGKSIPLGKLPGENFGIAKPVYPGAPLPDSPGLFPGAHLPDHPGVFPGARLPENPGEFPGAHLPEHPGEFPGAPLPKRPATEVLQARAIGEGGKSVPNPSDELGKLPIPKSEPAPPPARIASPTAAADSSPSKLRGVKTKMGDLLNEGLGGKPLRANIPLKDQIQSAITRQSLPDGFTPADSAAIAGYKYDPAAREFEVITNDGSRHVYGDVSPEQAETFDAASSKGTAWKELRDSSSAKVAKVVNGKRIATKPPNNLRSATPLDEAPRVPGSDEDLRGLLKKSVARVKSAKTK